MWEAIRRNRRASLVLVFLMAALLMGLGAAVGGALGAWGVGLIVASAVWLTMSLSAWFGGDGMVLWASGAKRITHADAPQLFNVAEEMSIAAGTPMPAVYIIDDTAPNAFATGRSPEKASIAVTKGLLAKLTRDELQGVIAHEMGHVRNRDTLYLTLVGILVGTIVLLCDLYLRAIWYGGGRGGSRRGSGRGGGPAQAVLIVVAIVLAIVAPIIARLMYLAISRRREYLADATAVEFTRYPEGLASALEKISGDKEVLEVANRATAHLYIVNPVKPFEERYSALGSTHPPVMERVAILRAMSAGATVRDYEQARHGIGAGPRRNIVRRKTLALAAANPAPLAPRPRVGTLSPDELKARLMHAAGQAGLASPAGIYFLLCACGSPVPVPGATARGVFQCVRCGRLHDLREGAATSTGVRRLLADGTSEPAGPAQAEPAPGGAETSKSGEDGSRAAAFEGTDPARRAGAS